MPSSLLPLELSVPFLVPTGVAPVARVCRALREAALNNATWIEVFARRYPCLAELPGFDKPADARSLIKSLLATPNYDEDSMPPVPRDAQGRAVPLRSETVLVVQLLRRAEWPAAHKPLMKFVGGFAQILADSHHENLRLAPNWNFDLFSEFRDDDARNQLLDVLDLPDTIEARVRDEDSTPPSAELINRFLRNFDQGLQHEVFVVYGDLISRIDDPSATCIGEPELSMSYAHDFFFGNNYPGTDETPWFLLDAEFDGDTLMPWVLRFGLGSYESETWDATHDGSQSFRFDLYHSPSCEILAFWDSAVERDERFEADGGEHSWPWFCQVLASSEPVRFPRA